MEWKGWPSMLREKARTISMVSMLLWRSHAGPRKHTWAGSHQPLVHQHSGAAGSVASLGLRTAGWGSATLSLALGGGLGGAGSGWPIPPEIDKTLILKNILGSKFRAWGHFSAQGNPPDFWRVTHFTWDVPLFSDVLSELVTALVFWKNKSFTPLTSNAALTQ